MSLSLLPLQSTREPVALFHVVYRCLPSIVGSVQCRGLVLLHRSDAVTILSANGSAAFVESCAPIGLKSRDSVILSQSFQPMAAQLSLKAALPLAKSLVTSSYHSNNPGSWLRCARGAVLILTPCTRNGKRLCDGHIFKSTSLRDTFS